MRHVKVQFGKKGVGKSNRVPVISKRHKKVTKKPLPLELVPLAMLAGYGDEVIELLK